MKSLNEIETISKRASRAIGFSWGEAEEIGKCVRLLELFGFPGIKNLNQYYQEINKAVPKANETFESLKIINKNNQPIKLNFCPISVGISFLDQIKKIEPLKKCVFQRIAYPLLLLPFLSIASEIIGKKILYKFNKKNFLLNFNVNIFSNFIEKELPSKAENIEVIFLENEDNFTDSEWKNLYEFSKDTFVEESESLMLGAAGGGLTDND